MFVSVVIDPGGKETAEHLAEDRVTDYYDVVRLYQYPMQDVMAITTLYKKKWRRVLVRPPEK